MNNVYNKLSIKHQGASIPLCTLITPTPMSKPLQRTRKLSYRKDDRAMRPKGALKIFESPWVRPWLLFNGLLFRSILWMCVQNLKFVALPVP